ncbi:nucleotidyl transferase AbiEii/AbiGii toxin family protein (plasmid) [Rhizobium sp. CB3090]|uniref:nucleotidyl transferase AbiEii/AbiGii toxin family protein n=1 Tax=Rhizobium sp. CB3090 TaxID=3039156 RepID=UPI0024B18EF4|nr:nucleotidyl transferase AbiEii/AbiGii toxin family protein [Rhizobium sp. CB3090]WFU13163.1 nucleotidyl transferase AbiEii/AbiGii toxin family protein [Rhizobium sp. CB3090]
MISKAEILETAGKVGLRPDVVEKDYALGWTLAGISAHEDLRETWIFKGGTCLKKCYFETYRFSEDLDFTLMDEAHLNQEFLKRVFGEIADWIYERSGLEIPAEGQSFDLFNNPRGNISCQGKLSYKGPVSPNVALIRLPRIKLDLTADERIVLPAVRTPVFHSYSDAQEASFEVLSYSYVETFGEKVRALAERTRPRDLYDVVNLFRNAEARPRAAELLDVLRQKCDFKGIAVPKLEDLASHRDALEGSWAAMLAHQLPALPPVDDFWSVLPEFFAWLTGGEMPVELPVFALAAGETVIHGRTFSLDIPNTSQTYLEIIRFAGGNRLCVDLDYQGTTRRIEPYSLRRTSEGNIVLHAFNLNKNEHRSYRVDRITGARATTQTFGPRYAVELTPSGPITIPHSRNGGSFGDMALNRPRLAPARSRAFGHPTYVYQCPVCQKKFRRQTNDSSLKPHKTPQGYPCPGRTGYLADTQY